MSKNISITVIIAVIVSAAAGCAEFNLLDTPQEVLKHPLGTDPIRVGMSKEEVTSIWGKPDQINRLKASDEWQTPKEEWVYIGRYTKIPLDKDYLFKTKYLVFDGNNLVSIENKPTYNAAEPKNTEVEKR